MMRKWSPQHLSVGVATQDPVLAQALHRPARTRHQLFLLRRRGSPRDHGRTRLSHLQRDGGQTQMLDQSTLVAHWKAKGLRFLQAVRPPEELPGQKIYHAQAQNHHLEAVLDRTLIDRARPALDRGAAGQDRDGDQQHRPQRRRDAVRHGGEDLRPCRPAARHHPSQLQGHRGPGLRRLAGARRHLRSRRRRATTMSARPFPAAASSSSRRANSGIVPEDPSLSAIP